ncbi:MAG: uroporphyrinogen-III synthase [Ktedonobacterales bacterium]
MTQQFEMHALAGRHIAITRPPEQAPQLAHLLEAAGARVTVLSSIDTAPLEETSGLDAAVERLAQGERAYDWVVFTSVNGVRALDQRLASLGRGWSLLRRSAVAAIGPATAQALEAHGITPALVPDEYVAEGILRGIGNVAGKRLLLLRVDIARKTLAEELRRGGAEVDEVTAYRTVVVPPDAARLRHVLDADRPDAITFTSSSTVQGLVQGLDAAGFAPSQALATIALACIGPVTAGTLREHGLEPAVVAEEYTMPGLVHALIVHFTSMSPASSPSTGSTREGA